MYNYITILTVRLLKYTDGRTHRQGSNLISKKSVYLLLTGTS